VIGARAAGSGGVGGIPRDCAHLPQIHRPADLPAIRPPVTARPSGLEHFPEKWSPVFRQKMRPLDKTRVLSGSLEPESTLERDALPSIGERAPAYRPSMIPLQRAFTPVRVHHRAGPRPDPLAGYPRGTGLFRPAFARRSIKPKWPAAQGLRAGGKLVSTLRDRAQELSRFDLPINSCAGGARAPDWTRCGARSESQPGRLPLIPCGTPRY
jgi:hypothetical protein